METHECNQTPYVTKTACFLPLMTDGIHSIYYVLEITSTINFFPSDMWLPAFIVSPTCTQSSNSFEEIMVSFWGWKCHFSMYETKVISFCDTWTPKRSVKPLRAHPKEDVKKQTVILISEIGWFVRILLQCCH